MVKQETFADRVISFNRNLKLHERLPSGIRAMNPFSDPEVMRLSSAFYHKFYEDNEPRVFLIGINPGRHGAGVTGIPFTDTKRLEQILDHKSEKQTHEPSSEFMYTMIDYLGGPEVFFKRFYINSICPLGFTIKTGKGEKNYNYYDTPELLSAVKPFLIRSLQEQVELGIERETAVCLGTGKNLNILTALNKEYGFFNRIIPLEHPRYIIQYKRKSLPFYLEKYRIELGRI